jgi:predicted secreted protein
MTDKKKKLTKKEISEKVKGKPALPKNTDKRCKPLAPLPQLRHYSDDEVLEILAQSGGIVTHAARFIGCDPTVLRKRIKKIPDGMHKLETEYRALAREKAMKSIMYHLDNMDKDITKYVMTAVGADMGFGHRTQIHLIDEKKTTIEITEDNVQKLKDQLEKAQGKMIEVEAEEVDKGKEDDR